MSQQPIPTQRLCTFCIKLGQGHWDACVGTWDLGTRDKGLGDPRQGTWGHQVWNPETCGTGTQEVKDRDAGM